MEHGEGEELDLRLVEHEVPPGTRAGPVIVDSTESSTDDAGESGPLTKNTRETEKEESSEASETAPKAIYISKQDGEVRKADALVPAADGSIVIVTPDAEPWSQERPLKPRDLKILTVFSVLSLVLFFPTGVAAFFYALKTSKAYYQGLEQGNLDDARTKSKRCEKLITASIVCGLLTIVLILSLVEKAALATNDENQGTPRFLHGLH